MNYIGQSIGILAIIVSFFIYIQKSRGKMIFLKLVTDFLWGAHHLSISSYTAVATTGIAVFRELVFLKNSKNVRGIWEILIFSVLFVLSSVFTWKDWFSVFPASASVLSTIAFGSDRIKLIRIFAFLSSVCMLVYGIHYFSIPTVINEILVESSIIIALIKRHKMKG